MYIMHTTKHFVFKYYSSLKYFLISGLNVLEYIFIEIHYRSNDFGLKKKH